MTDWPLHNAGHGYDVFGLNSRSVERGRRWARLFYRYYFRVSSHGHEHIPAQGPAILAANHGGTLPLDAAMIWTDVVEHIDPPRVPRPLLDMFVPLLPIVGTLFARAGAVNGTRENVRRLLDDGELVLVFPEGVPGIGKPFRQRYHLQDWRVGHVELAIWHRAPVVPVAVIGPEEAWPLATRIERFHMFGAPFLPVPATPVPLPVHCHVLYGEPIVLHKGLPREAADDPAIIKAGAARVRDQVQLLLDEGLRRRRGVFR